MTLQTIRGMLFTLMALFALDSFADEKASTVCGAQASPLSSVASLDYDQLTTAASIATQAIFQNAVLLENRIAGETNASCCKICRNSQACGDDCMNWSKICHVGPGCACQQ